MLWKKSSRNRVLEEVFRSPLREVRHEGLVNPTTFICLFTYSMVQSPSWEAKWFAASQEIPHISRNPKVHYRTHKLPPPVSILGQPSPVHIPTSHLLEIRPNIIHPSGIYTSKNFILQIKSLNVSERSIYTSYKLCDLHCIHTLYTISCT